MDPILSSPRKRVTPGCRFIPDSTGDPPTSCTHVGATGDPLGCIAYMLGQLFHRQFEPLAPRGGYLTEDEQQQLYDLLGCTDPELP